MTRLLYQIATVPVLVLALAACGPGGKATATATTVAANRQTDNMRKFAQCMRANGVDMGDDGASGDGSGAGGVASMAPITDPATQAALGKCRQYLPTPQEAPKPKPSDIAKAREYSKCMRQHGITNFPDPNADGAIDGKAFPVDMNDPTLQKAIEACKSLQPAMVMGRD